MVRVGFARLLSFLLLLLGFRCLTLLGEGEGQGYG